MSQRRELVALASAQGTSIAALARRFEVSRKTVYKWLARHGEPGGAGLMDRSRRPGRCPHRTGSAIEAQVLWLRSKHPSWGGRKLHHRLKRLGVDAPAPSTITRILRDHGLIDPADSAQRHRWQRFERAAPNELWQMDFKSPVELTGGGSCHPLTVIDDHSRYALGLHACANQQHETVHEFDYCCVQAAFADACANQQHETVHEQLTRLFERYGLPWAILSDNGSPWRYPGMAGSYTRLEVWLMRLDVRVSHGRPFHPQTQGKDERFHRTLQAEVLQGRCFRDRASLQGVLDPWREVYNHERPHEALDMRTPGERYRPASRSMPAVLPTIEYGPGDQVRRVGGGGLFRFHRRRCRAGQAFAGQSVALRPTRTDGQWEVFYSRTRIGCIDLTQVAAGGFTHVLGPRSSDCGACTQCPEEQTV